jgi:hypothetical protein
MRIIVAPADETQTILYVKMNVFMGMSLKKAPYKGLGVECFSRNKGGSLRSLIGLWGLEARV